jgi:hypothetical protein
MCRSKTGFFTLLDGFIEDATSFGPNGAHFDVADETLGSQIWSLYLIHVGRDVFLSRLTF